MTLCAPGIPTSQSCKVRSRVAEALMGLASWSPWLRDPDPCLSSEIDADRLFKQVLFFSLLHAFALSKSELAASPVRSKRECQTPNLLPQ